MKSFTKYLAGIAALVLGLGLAQQPTNAATILYATTGSGGIPSSLFTIDPTTGASTLVGAIGFSEVVSIDFNPLNGVLYGIANSGHTLITINTATGVGTAVAPLSPSFQSPDMSFSAAGILYSWSEPGPDHLNTIDIATGATTEVGSSGIGTSQLGLDINSAGTIFVKSSGEVYTVDPTTGLATTLISLDRGFSNILAFDPSDTLYTAVRDGGDSFLYTVDLSTGTTTLIGATGLERLGALAFAPDLVAVPEPATLALLAFGLAGLGFSRRKPA